MCFHSLFRAVCFVPVASHLRHGSSHGRENVRRVHRIPGYVYFPPSSSVSATLPSTVSPSRSLSIFFFSLFFLFWLPHFLTRISPLLSPRTLATRTVMSSMRSWILQLWPPLPAHEALLTLAQGILSSMQPSSLAHTSACQFRAFPPQTLASRYTD